MTRRHPIVSQLREIRRHRRGVSQRSLAAVIGADRTAVGNWETGRFDPRLASVTAWANALGYDLALVRRRRRDPGWAREMREPPKRTAA